MAGTRGRSARDLIRELCDDAPRFRFFQAVRLLALETRRRGGKRHGALPAGLRFRTPASLSFPASELLSCRPSASDADENDAVPEELTVAFMGLIGPSGVLPRPYTELLIDRRQRHRDTSAHAFLDLFSHRATALFYEAWRKYRYWLGVEGGEHEGFTRHLLDLSGLGLSRLRERLSAPAQSGLGEAPFLHYAGLLSQKPLSAQAIVTVITAFFGTHAELLQFVGQWIPVPTEEQTRLANQACELGRSTFAGERMWDRQTKIQLRLGPVRRARFERLLPGGVDAPLLRTLMQFMVGHGLACDINLILDKRDVPPPRFDGVQRLMLGGNTWLHDRPLAEHPDHVRYTLLR